MKNLTLVLAFIIATSFALTAQRGSSNSNNRSNNSNYNNNSQLNRNPNLGQTNIRRGSDNMNNQSRHNYSGNHYNHHHNGHNSQYNSNHHNHNNHHSHHNHHTHHNHHSHHSSHVNSNGYGHYTNYHPGWNSICVADFNRGCRSIRHYGFDNDRLCAAKRFASSRHLSVNQVREIMHMFTFESTKLKFAKFAFSRTCDVQNYYLVFDCLTFNSSRRELDCFINNHYY